MYAAGVYMIGYPASTVRIPEGLPWLSIQSCRHACQRYEDAQHTFTAGDWLGIGREYTFDGRWLGRPDGIHDGR